MFSGESARRYGLVAKPILVRLDCKAKAASAPGWGLFEDLDLLIASRWGRRVGCLVGPVDRERHDFGAAARKLHAQLLVDRHADAARTRPPRLTPVGRSRLRAEPTVVPALVALRSGGTCVGRATRAVESHWKTEAATEGKGCPCAAGANDVSKPNRLPPFATGCLNHSMVRRGSTVRVRQRALPERKSPEIGIFVV
jgi:hypothetical protein